MHAPINQLSTFDYPKEHSNS